MKFVMSACPHDTSSRPEQWFAFAQQLSYRSGFSVRFSLSLDFPEFRKMFPELDLVYANPNDALHLVDQRGFIPLARMADRFDEGVVVCRRDEPQGLQEIPQKRIATCVSMIITDIVMRHLVQKGITPGPMVDKPSWGAVLAALLNKETDMAILYRDFFLELRPETRQELMVVTESNEQVAFHVFLLAPQHQDMVETFQGALLGFHEEPGSARVLQELGCERLVPATKEEVLAFSSA